MNPFKEIAVDIHVTPGIQFTRHGVMASVNRMDMLSC